MVERCENDHECCHFVPIVCISDGINMVSIKLQALVYDIFPLEEGAGKRCSECEEYPKHSEDADRVGGQLSGDKEYPFSGLTKSGRVWRKVSESDALFYLRAAVHRRDQLPPKGRCRKAMLGVWVGMCGKNIKYVTSRPLSILLPVRLVRSKQTWLCLIFEELKFDAKKYTSFCVN